MTDLVRVLDGGDTLQLGAFTLTRTGLQVKGRPSFDEWQRCGVVLHRIEGAVQFWIGDWVNYGRARWGEKYAAAVAATDLDQHTLENYAYVAQNIGISRRRENLSFSAHSEVAGLPTAAEQNRWLDAAEAGDNGKPWSSGRLRREIRMARLETRPASALPGVFDVLCADPPWAYDNSGFDQSAAAQYPTLDIDAIATLPDTDPSFPKAADNSVLFLWATSPQLSDSFQVIEAWGFTYKASLVWAKDRAPNIGWWVRTRHELLLIAERGGLHPMFTPDSIVQAASGRHSEKPAEFYRLIEINSTTKLGIERVRKDDGSLWIDVLLVKYRVPDHPRFRPSFCDLYRIIQAIAECEDLKYPPPFKGRRQLLPFLYDCVLNKTSRGDVARKHHIPIRNGDRIVTTNGAQLSRDDSDAALDWEIVRADRRRR